MQTLLIVLLELLLLVPASIAEHDSHLISGQTMEYRDELLASEISTASILQPVRNLELYDRPRENKWALGLHGIRHTMLHPATWGTRLDQRTQSHRLIPIKRFYLRSSERPTYRLDRFRIEFSFDPVSQTKIAEMPHATDPVLEIGFGGEYRPQEGGAVPIRNRSFLARISAFPSVPSGIFYRSQLVLLAMKQVEPINIETGKKYVVSGEFSDTEATFYLNGHLWGSVREPDVNKGLVSLISGWHPTRIKKLVFEGHELKDGQQLALKESGVVKIPKGRKGKRGKKTPVGNEVLDKMLFERGAE